MWQLLVLKISLWVWNKCWNKNLFYRRPYLMCFVWSQFLCSSARTSTTTTMVIDSKNGDAGSLSVRGSKKTFTDDLHSTFSSPLAWILVLALIITWSCVFVIMFDLLDYKTISGKERCSFPPRAKHVCKALAHSTFCTGIQ